MLEKFIPGPGTVGSVMVMVLDDDDKDFFAIELKAMITKGIIFVEDNCVWCMHKDSARVLKKLS